jgi:hypothetical protein
VPDDLATAFGDERLSGQSDAQQDVEHGVSGAEAAEEALKRRLAREGVEEQAQRLTVGLGCGRAVA